MSDLESLDARREQAKAALLRTVAAAQHNPQGRDATDHLTRLLAGMEGLGDDQTQKIAEDLVNALGNLPQLKDEHGNLIVEISEEVKEGLPTAVRPGVLIDQPLRHIWDMPPGEAAAKRLEIDALWEALEEEEANEEQHNKRRRRSPSPAKKTEGKKAHEPRHASNGSPSGEVHPPDEVPRQSRVKKSVKFEDGSLPGIVDAPPADWGDVVPARLRKKAPLLSGTGSKIMKFDIVEKWEGQVTQGPIADSDDEEVQPKKTHGRDADAKDAQLSDETSDDANQPIEGHGSEDSADDADLARLAASSYLAKRDRIVQDALLTGVKCPIPHGITGEIWEEEWVPLNASLAEPPPKTAPVISRFNTERRGAPPSVKVAGFGSGVSEVVKTGKVIDGQLIAPADSDSDENDNLGEVGKKTIELLRLREDHLATEFTDEAEVLAKGPSPVLAASTPRNLQGANTQASGSQSESWKPNKFPNANSSESPPFPSMIVESPSFPRMRPASRKSPLPIQPSTLVRDVQESSTLHTTVRDSSSTQRVSRFKAERI